MTFANSITSVLERLSLDSILKLITNDELKQELLNGDFNRNEKLKTKLLILMEEVEAFKDDVFKTKLISTLDEVGKDIFKAKFLLEGVKSDDPSIEFFANTDGLAKLEENINYTTLIQNCFNNLKNEMQVTLQELKQQSTILINATNEKSISSTSSIIDTFQADVKKKQHNLDLLIWKDQIPERISQALLLLKDFSYKRPPVLLSSLSYKYCGNSHQWKNEIENLKTNGWAYFYFPCFILPPLLCGWLIEVYFVVTYTSVELYGFIVIHDKFNEDCPKTMQIKVQLSLMSQNKQETSDWQVMTLSRDTYSLPVFQFMFSIGTDLFAEICFNKL